MRACPWSIRMVLADPAAILANEHFMVCVRASGPFFSLDQSYHLAPLYSIKRMYNVAPVEHGKQTFHRSLRVPRYSPKMRLASSTARMMVSWSGLFMTVRSSTKAGIKLEANFRSRLVLRFYVSETIATRRAFYPQPCRIIKPARLGRASHQAWMASGRTKIIDPSPASGSAGHRPPLPCRERPRRRTLPQRRRRGRPRRPLSVVFRACSPG